MHGDGRLAITPGGENNHSNRRQAVNVSSPTARHNAAFSGGMWDYSGEGESEWKPFEYLSLFLSPLTFLTSLYFFLSLVAFTLLPPFHLVAFPPFPPISMQYSA